MWSNLFYLLGDLDNGVDGRGEQNPMITMSYVEHVHFEWNVPVLERDYQ